MYTRTPGFLAAALLSLLTGCGGGDGGSESIYEPEPVTPPPIGPVVVSMHVSIKKPFNDYYDSHCYSSGPTYCELPKVEELKGVDVWFVVDGDYLINHYRAFGDTFIDGGVTVPFANRMFYFPINLQLKDHSALLIYFGSDGYLISTQYYDGRLLSFGPTQTFSDPATGHHFKITVGIPNLQYSSSIGVMFEEYRSEGGPLISRWYWYLSGGFFLTPADPTEF
jgi:hypothetical protein